MAQCHGIWWKESYKYEINKSKVTWLNWTINKLNGEIYNLVFFFNKKINNFNIFFHIPVLDLQVFNSKNAKTNINCIIKYLQIDQKNKYD